MKTSWTRLASDALLKQANGENLIDYDQRVNRIGIGISLTDWLD